MSPWASTLRNQKGVALPLALFVLVSLSVLVLTFLSMGGQEPQISRNLTDSSQARYSAEAGIESAFDQLASAPGAGTGSWADLLSKSAVSGSTPQAHWITPVVSGNPVPQQLPGLAATFGTYTVQIRNDSLAADQALTGVAPEVGVTNTDGNGVVIVTAAGTHNNVTRQIQVVMRRVSLPPFPGAYTMPGVQADLLFKNPNFTIDGRDYMYTCTANCSDPNPANRTYDYVANPNQSKMKFGIAVQPGIQANLTPATTYEQRAEYTLDNAQKQGNVMGKNQVGGGFTTGLNTVAPPADPSEVLNPAKMQSFLDQLASFSGTQVIQSTIACAQDVSGVPVGLIMNGNSADPSKPTLTNNCGMNQTVDLGSRTNPKLVYFKGELDPTSAFAGVAVDGQPVKGAGILVVEDGDFRVWNKFDWDGIIIVTGRYVSSIFEKGGHATIHGATVSNETIWDEYGTNLPLDGPNLWDGVFNSSNQVVLRNSQQNLDMVQRALLFRMSTWREI